MTMAVRPLYKSLMVVIFIGISFFMLTLLNVHQTQQPSFFSTAGGPSIAESISVKLDETVVNNISERLLESIKSDAVLCAAITPMPEEQKKKKVKARGVSNRNKGLEWVRNNFVDPRGVVYFADDDNIYDHRLFDEIRSVKKVGMWPVGLLTHFGLSSPIVKNGSVTGFYDGWVANRKYPVDMAGFAVSVDVVLKYPNLKMPFVPGYEEDGFLKGLNFQLSDIEPKADNCTQIYVWHTQTKKNKAPLKANETVYGSTNIWTLYKQIEQ